MDAAEVFADSVPEPEGVRTGEASVEVSMGRADSTATDLSASFEDRRGS